MDPSDNPTFRNTFCVPTSLDGEEFAKVRYGVQVMMDEAIRHVAY